MGPGGVPYVLPTTLAQVQQDPQILHMQQAPMRMQAPMQGAMQHMQQQYHAAAAQQAYVPLGGLQQAAPQFYYAPATFAYAGAPGLAAFDPAAGPSAAAPQPLAAPAPAPAAPAPGPRGPRGGRGRRGGAAARQQAVWQQAAAAGGLDAMGNVVGGGGGLGGMGMAALTGQGGYVVMTVEDILAVLQALPRGRSAVQAVGHCLGCLDSRCARARGPRRSATRSRARAGEGAPVLGPGPGTSRPPAQRLDGAGTPRGPRGAGNRARGGGGRLGDAHSSRSPARATHARRVQTRRLGPPALRRRFGTGCCWQLAAGHFGPKRAQQMTGNARAVAAASAALRTACLDAPLAALNSRP